MRSTKLLAFVLFLIASNIITLFADEETSNNAHFGRVLRGGYRAVQTCDKYPRVCSASGSPGPDCCKKKCVNVSYDGSNCGNCGKKCKFGQLCCKGKCVNVFNDEKNCGKCSNKCKKGNQCVKGICNYA
ncbi:hypothetical protein Leryth_016138 [Lithospermum erythrorhizon]|nr:hypothetical protein Leryth_016138 [Lithospermum erythrorhizon]